MAFSASVVEESLVFTGVSALFSVSLTAGAAFCPLLSVTCAELATLLSALLEEADELGAELLESAAWLLAFCALATEELLLSLVVSLAVAALDAVV